MAVHDTMGHRTCVHLQVNATGIRTQLHDAVVGLRHGTEPPVRVYIYTKKAVSDAHRTVLWAHAESKGQTFAEEQSRAQQSRVEQHDGDLIDAPLPLWIAVLQQLSLVSARDDDEAAVLSRHSLHRSPATAVDTPEEVKQRPAQHTQQRCYAATGERGDVHPYSHSVYVIICTATGGQRTKSTRQGSQVGMGSSAGPGAGGVAMTSSQSQAVC